MKSLPRVNQWLGNNENALKEVENWPFQNASLAAAYGDIKVFLMGHSRPLFLYFRLFNTVDSMQVIHSFRTADLQCRKRPLYPTEPQQSPIQLECCHDSVVRGEVVASRKGFDELIFPSRSMLRSCLRLRLEERKRRSVFFYFFFFLFFFFSEHESVALRSK